MEFKVRDRIEKLSVELDYLSSVTIMAWMWANQSQEKTMARVLSSVSDKMEEISEELSHLAEEQEATA